MFGSILNVQKEIVKKNIKLQDLVIHYFSLIEQYDNKINSFLTLNKQNSINKAEYFDNLLEKTNSEDVIAKYPLIGTVFNLKDLFLTKGIRTTAGSKVLENYIPPYNSTVYEKLINSGAILIGKVNCDAWAHGSSGENSDFFATKNPWNLGYVPGGSSSGSAASVAAGFSLASFGTDTCGSIRLPANYCGCVGLKPTYGIISRYGVIAMASSFDTVGPIASTVDDVKILFENVSGYDGKDANVGKGLSIRKYTGNKPLKIGIPKEFTEKLEGEVFDELMFTKGVLEKLGHKVKTVSLPHTKYAISVYYIIQPAEVSSNLGRFDGIRYGYSRDYFGMEAKRRIILGTFVLSSGYYEAYYLKAAKVRNIIYGEMMDLFGDIDLILAPVAPTKAFKLNEKVNDPLKMYLSDIYAATANLTGIPSLAIPTRLSTDGLPLGVQLMGPKYSENLLFDVARKFHKEIEFKNMNADLKKLEI